MSIRKALEELLSIVEIHQKNTGNNFAWAEVEHAKELLTQPELESVVKEPSEIKMKHKHYNLIVAWANGAEIQQFCQIDKEWEDSIAPAWNNATKYRIKPDN